MSPRPFLPVLALALLAAPARGHAQQSTSPPRSETEARLRSKLDAFFGRRTLLPAVADTTASRAMASTCPMPVARPDTTRLERMPRVRRDSIRMAPMPVAQGCVADTK